MMPKRAEDDGSVVNYGPLSIDDSHHEQDDDSIQISSSLSLCRSSTTAILCRLRWLRYRCRRFRKIALFSVLFVLCFIISILIVSETVFHISFRNLLRIIFGAGSSKTDVVLEATCLGNTTLLKGGISVEHLNLTRTAVGFTKSLTDDTEIISHGFYWDEQDAETTKWRPQGVTTFQHTQSGRRFALVSWYGRAEEGYANRGGRISFVDISSMQHESSSTTTKATITSEQYYSYAHVLLVDDNFCTLPNIHVGGIEQVNGTLYVADSREGEMNILEFDIERGLYELPSEDDDLVDETMLGYRYLLRQSSSIRSPTKPSFLSYDNDHNQFVVGTYFRCGGKVGMHTDSKKCFDRPENRIVWVDGERIGESNGTIDDSCSNLWHYFSEMQGAASAIVGNMTRVWVSSSYGAGADSHLHVIDISPLSKLECLGAHDIVRVEDATIFRFPPGLEDLHIKQSEADRFMWMLTEFEQRIVFATKLGLILG
ncbi:hypothetical protein ACHAWU_006626 [Discostella pseudostelligera]|uniref:Uncharacterized protein n=1 Tax=Discostella pseudostelligera TaxID=259834 RepID=A0ABD3M8K7_9STRA